VARKYQMLSWMSTQHYRADLCQPCHRASLKRARVRARSKATASEAVGALPGQPVSGAQVRSPSVDCLGQRQNFPTATRPVAWDRPMRGTRTARGSTECRSCYGGVGVASCNSTRCPATSTSNDLLNVVRNCMPIKTSVDDGSRSITPDRASPPTSTSPNAVSL
jgi:hypothetical protein